MPGSPFSYVRLDAVQAAPARSRVGARVGRQRRWRWVALLAVLAALGLGTAWAHPGGDGWGHDQASYGTSWWVRHTPKPELGGQASDDPHEGDHVGDHHGPPSGVFGCMLPPSKASLAGAFNRSLQATLTSLRSQYGGLYYGLHYHYTVSAFTVTDSAGTVTIAWSGSVHERGSGNLVSGSGTGTAHYLWQGCHWVQDGSTSYQAN